MKITNMDYRNDGMAFALKIVEKDGIDAWRREIKERHANMLPSCVQKKDLDAAMRTTMEEMTEAMHDTHLLLTLSVLLDEFAFSPEMLDRYKARYVEKFECLQRKNVTWEDMRTILAQEAGQLLELRHLEYSTQM